MTKIKYIGVRPGYRENLYGTGLVFEQGQVASVDDAVAAKMIRHKDQYVLADKEYPVADVVIAPVVESDKAEDKVEEEAQNMRDSIAVMDKQALENFAKTHFNVGLDKRKGVDNLRTQVNGLVDQYGLE